MHILRYDGSFFGLICALAPFLRSGKLPDAIERENVRQPSLIAEDDNRETSSSALSTVLARDPEVFRLPGVARESWLNAWHAFLSEVDGIELAIARYLLLAMEKKSGVDAHLADDRVHKVQRLARKVLFERHRFMGLLRFRNIGPNLYYASLNSDNFILPVLGPFFVDRFTDQQWIIHDRKRELAAVYDLHTWTIIPRSAADMPDDSPQEECTQQLWQCFFSSIAVRERLNLALQQKCIPKKYWQDLIEKLGQ